ncbi:MAG: outer membrane protein assembly factor BamE [Spirochaetaceae bacterium]|nr:outer membrane protein assembly factor BamE [Spirochaetaceae bacterium]
MSVSRKGALAGAAVLHFLLLLPLCLAAQTPPGNPPYGTPGNPPGSSGPESLIGATLEELLSLAGPPHSVYPVRGLEIWQDDVVFVYPSLDVYLFKDRVWQVSPREAYRVTTGDTREQVEAALGPVFTEIPGAREGEYALVYVFSDRPWPLALRVHFRRGADAVAALYIYRSDF